jgi:DNA-binding CsgD family transcriptional regulator
MEWCVEGDRPKFSELGLQIGGSLWFFWDVRGHVQEGRAPLKDLLALPSTQAHTVLRIRALLTAAWLAYVQGDAEEVARLTTESSMLAEELGDRLGLARALAIDGVSGSLYSADLERVSDVLTRALALGRELADTWTIGFATFSIGLVDIRQGNLEASWINSEECRHVSALAGNTWGQACALYRLSVLRVHGRQIQEAIDLQQESLRMNWELRNLRVIGLNLVVLGCCTAGSASPSDRAQLLGAAEVLFDAAGYSLPPSLNGIYEPALAQIRASLGDRLEQAWNRGRSLSVEDAVGVGLSIGHHGNESRTGLSEREEQVAALVAEGLRDREIAERLGISRRTVDNHLRNIFSKANVSTRSGLTSWFLRSKSD